ncbi:sodium- and chloride-dependent glycine transporter 1-like [Haliotis rufescens]|uniref:sodium- and chloride-dependent glycine transporter 1-like n=1 Tax=Haliotis rufescens TaxID=6454 RepID=UPI00201F96A3|nr:sodium- and chloride-dependent glycine transporter 1-like [Haliotis rufescens]
MTTVTEKIVMERMTNEECPMEKCDELYFENTKDQRAKWNSRLEYILSLVGFCVGFGNLWRFPYICNRNGGGAFLLPFLLCLLIIGFPVFFLEVSLSQFSGRGTPRVWSFCPMFKGVGVGALVMYVICIPYYNILLAWPIYYMVKSCSSILPWTTCDNSWNTDLCVEDVRNITFSSNMTAQNDNMTVSQRWDNVTLAHTAAEEFWQYNVLSVSRGLEEVGSVQWHIVGCLFASYVIIFVCMIRGVKSVGKAVYVTAIVPYILLIIIFISTLMQPGAGSGLLYFVTPDFGKLLDVQVWLEAFLQVMYSLGLGWGTIGTASSYNKFHEPCLKDAIIVSTISEGTSIFAGLVTFAILGVMSEKTGVHISKVVSSGPGLGFVAYPEALVQLPVPQLWSFLFFLMLLTVGLDSQFMNVEVISTAIVDRYPDVLSRKRHLVTAGICVVCFLAGILLCTQGGPYIFQLLDWYISALSVFLFCTLECVSVVYFYGVKQMGKDVEMMLGKPLPTIVKILWAFVIPAVLLMAFLLTLLRYQPPTYGKYSFPGYASVIGWFIASVSIIPLPIYIILAVKKHMGSHTFTESIQMALRPEDAWRPSDPLYRKAYRENLVDAKYSFKDHIKSVFRK